MPDWARLEEISKRLEPIRKIFGPEKRRAVPVIEDCVNYPLDEVVVLTKLLREIENGTIDDVKEKIPVFSNMLDKIAPVDNPKERIYLWTEGNMPAETDYTDPADYRYNHGPDFKPYMIEMLVDQDVTPKGAILICAGGDHGDATVPEGYQCAMDLNSMGYQCFVLLNRTNHNPWTAKEAGVDAARALRIIRKRAKEYRIKTDNIAFAGFSNGGLTGEGLIENFSGEKTVQMSFPGYVPDALDEIDATPDAYICVYGPRFVGDKFNYDGVVYPPTFFAVGREDTAMDNLNYTYPDLIEHGVKVEVHTFAGVPHGQAGAKLLDGYVKYPNFELWLTLADAFLQDIFTTMQ